MPNKKYLCSIKTLQQAYHLFRKELLTEFRLKYAIGGILLYVASSVFVIYFSVLYQNAIEHITPVLWSVFFWLVVLFAVVNAATRSFSQESNGRQLYYYTLASPQAFILSKLLYNFIVSLVLSVLSLLIFSTMLGNPVERNMLFFIAVLLGSTSYSFLFTLISAIAAKAGNSSTLSVVLGFPIVIPLLIFIVKLSREAFWTDLSSNFENNLFILLGFNVILVILSLILFPYLWRD
ncbi:MAG: heme exporter protein CcmB [Chitinophagales bacterium]